MLKTLRRFKPASLVVPALLLVAATVAPAFLGAHAGAAQITSRKITLSTSQTSTVATYSVSFTAISTAQEMIIDFCANDPIPGDTCTFASTTVPTVSSPTSSLGTASTVGSGSPVHTIKITGLTISAGAFSVNVTAGVTNPSTNTSFYARILTYTTGNATNYVPANTSGNATTIGTGVVDTGGVALSTNALINVQAKVFETLSFCVFDNTASCGTAPSIFLGASGTNALDTTNTYINTKTSYTLATNASSGASVTMTGWPLCRQTTLSNANCPTGASQFTITGFGSSAVAIAAGTEQFGLCADKTGSSGITVATAYADSVSTNNCHTGFTSGQQTTYSGSSRFGFDDTNIEAAAGSQILSSSGPITSYTDPLVFAANIASTTEAGLYQTNLNMVATGTF